MGRLEGRTAIITGGASGIGRATALLWTREGARLAVADVDAAAGEEVVAEIAHAGGEAIFVRCDVTRADETADLAEEMARRYGGPDVLFNNAGVPCVGTLHETDEAAWDQVMAVNVKGIYLTSRAVVPQMIARGGGVILNMSSAIAFIGLARRAAYAASKGAVLAMTRCMALDYAPYNIRVNAICPGTIHTPFVERYLRESYPDYAQGLAEVSRRQLTGRLGRPEDVAAAALYLASDDAAFVTGSPLIVDGGMSGAR